jgi:hypothetical protein
MNIGRGNFIVGEHVNGSSGDLIYASISNRNSQQVQKKSVDVNDYRNNSCSFIRTSIYNI